MDQIGGSEVREGVNVRRSAASSHLPRREGIRFWNSGKSENEREGNKEDKGLRAGEILYIEWRKGVLLCDGTVVALFCTNGFAHHASHAYLISLIIIGQILFPFL